MAGQEINGEGPGGGASRRGRRAADNAATGEAPTRRLVTGARGRGRAALRVAGRAASNAWRDRVLGLAAEAGFWQLLSLPPLLLALLGTIGYIADALGSDAVNSIRASLLRGASDLLTPEVVDNVVGPTVDQILSRGRPDVISIGFVLSLWTGSTAMATYVNTITIAYGQRDLRSAVRSRLVALRLYIAQVLTGVVILPALVLGPGLLANLLRANQHPVVKMLLQQVFWPAVGLLALAMLTSLYHQSLPQRRPWLHALPGAIFALLGWLLGSYLLRLYLELVFGNELVYGSLAAPVAALLFFYITALAVLLGAELNGALDKRGADSPAGAGRPADDVDTGTEAGDAKRPPEAAAPPPGPQSAPPPGSPDGPDGPDRSDS
ncbi:YhjD/YihY/BrkB family envelope integrity protein [Pseudofrankia asymbiotica]|uniref:YhjD/YihY/BrkB family envelope integrity protein n=1 Tax=Pseudofrankia asymbiotica TaxID=1834516 RepID=UPI0009D6F4D0